MKYTIEIDFNGNEELLSFQKEQVQKLVKSFFEINGINPLELNSKNETKCSKCGSDEYVKNGVSSNRQRFKCLKCGKTFSAVTNTSVHRLQKIDKWSNFVFLILSSKVPLSLTELSKKIGITRMTAHTWKHKLLSSLIGQSKIQIGDVVEIDEIFQSFCLKGQLMEDRTDIEKKHDMNKENAVFLCAHNRNGDFDFYPLRIQRLGQIHSKYIGEAVQYFKIKPGTTVITDKSKGSIKYFKSRDDINHLTFKSQSGETKVIHNNYINSTMRHFKEWKSHFHGYSTKYIWNYLKWYRFHKMFVRHIQDEIESSSSGLRKMVRSSVKDNKAYLRHSNIHKYYDEYLKRA